MLQDLVRHEKSFRVIATSVAIMAIFVAYTRTKRNNPFPGIPKTNQNLLDLLFYDPKKRDEETDYTLPIREHAVSLREHMLIVNSPDLARDLLVNAQNRYQNGHKIGRSPWIAEFHKVLIGGENIGNARRESWRRRRDVLVQQFQPRAILSQILPSVIEKSERLIKQIQAYNGKPVDIDKYFVELTCGVIFILSVLLKPLLDFFGWRGLGAAEISKNRKFVLRIMDEIKNGRSKRLYGSPPSDETAHGNGDLPGTRRRRSIDQRYAAHDLCWPWHNSPFTDIVDLLPLTRIGVPGKVRQEIQAVAPEVGDLTALNLGKLRYTSAAIKENMHLHPPVTVSLHQACEDILVNDVVVPKQTTIIVSTARIHRLSKYFEKPLSYSPERWLQEEEDLIQDLESSGVDRGSMNKAFLSFSCGAHSCLDMNLAYLEMRVVTVYLVKQFHIRYNGPVPTTSGLISALKDKVLIEFHPRTE